jgi:pimeloyl-ACP methyl ester carboxylesterase
MSSDMVTWSVTAQRSTLANFLTVLALLWFPHLVLAATTYTVYPFSLPYIASPPSGMNDFGQITFKGPSYDIYIYNWNNAGITAIPPKGWESLYPQAINDIGQVVMSWPDYNWGIGSGIYNLNTGVWQPNQAIPPNASGLDYVTLNNTGLMGGAWFGNDETYNALIYNTNAQTYTLVPGPQQFSNSIISSINDGGMAVFNTFSTSYLYNYNNNSYTQLPANLGGDPVLLYLINNSDQVVGLDNANGETVVYDLSSGAYTLIKGLGRPIQINNQGLIVGYVDGYEGRQAAVAVPSSLASNIQFVSPFLLGAKNLGDIDIPTLLPNAIGPTATALAADGTSAAIVLYATSTKAPVTFTASNGTTLLKYDQHFLTSPPLQGAVSIKVTPISIGSMLYAVALLQAPPSGVAPAYSTPIAVIAQQQGGPVQQANLPLVPPPVLLLHGLWGDQNSLSLYDATFMGEEPWSANPNLIYTSNYSGTASFASPDSIQQVIDDVALELQSLQSAGIVVGRTDVVAHSMGGLLARSYSEGRKSGPCDSGATKTAPYRSYIDRCQGQFHTIVTLDTPEAGSTLPTYLLKNQDDPLSPNAGPVDITLWLAFCGSNPETTVGECLASHGKPVTGGAIASLVPSSKAIRGAPSPNIPNAHWVAVTATNTNGIEHASLQEFIDASNPTDNEITLKEILHGPNDDVVALRSQLSVAPAAHVMFTELAHTDIFGLGAAVTNTPEVVTQAACWLTDPTSSSCGQSQVLKASIANNKPMTPTTGQVEIEQVPTTGIVGQPLVLHLKANNAQSFEISQSGEESSVTDKIDAQPPNWDGSSLQILPRRIGKTKITILTIFMDGRFEIDNGGWADFGVDPASIASLHAVRRGHEVLMTEAGTHYQLSPEIVLQDLSEPVSVRSSSSYSVVSPAADPAVTVDNSGKLTAIHSGSTTIEVEFEGHTDNVTVVVQ